LTECTEFQRQCHQLRFNCTLYAQIISAEMLKCILWITVSTRVTVCAECGYSNNTKIKCKLFTYHTIFCIYLARNSNQNDFTVRLVNEAT